MRRLACSITVRMCIRAPAGVTVSMKSAASSASGLGTEEVRPGGGGTVGCWVDPGLTRDFPDGGGGERDPDPARLVQPNIHRRDRVSGAPHEYKHAAIAARMTFSAGTRLAAWVRRAASVARVGWVWYRCGTCPRARRAGENLSASAVAGELAVEAVGDGVWYFGPGQFGERGGVEDQQR
jgi:hypothetical protein